MKCRHCSVEFHDHWEHFANRDDVTGTMALGSTRCPACKHLHIAYIYGTQFRPGGPFLYPRSVSREPVDPAVPQEFAANYLEACEVLDISPKASAALSRRIMQHILRECAKVKEPTLDKEIQKVLDGNMVPSHLAESLDAVRTVGNFAAHPIKSTSSGEVVDVEPGEAEWNLDTVEALFDFYFVQPARTAAKRAALNQ